MRDLIGVKYCSHGRNIEKGFDCYGLVIEYLRRVGIKMYDEFFGEGKNHFEKIDKPEKHCIVEVLVHGEPHHVGVYLGNGQMLHTTSETGSCIVPLHIFKNRIGGYYKVNNKCI